MSMIKMCPVVHANDITEGLKDKYPGDTTIYDEFYTYDDNALVMTMPDSAEENEAYEEGFVRDMYALLNREGLEWGTKFFIEVE